jgi:hypothetical protein
MQGELSPDDAARFARTYVKLVEALVREGVPEHVARLEARSVAYLLVWELDPETEGWED